MSGDSEPTTQPAELTSAQDPQSWLVTTPILDLEDSKLRLRAQSLTQLCKTDRERALAVYNFVKRIPIGKPLKLRTRTARQVMDVGRGDAEDKASVLVALMRSAGIACRLQYVEVDGQMLRGLVDTLTSASRPVAQMWLDGRWQSTDTFIFDSTYMAAARQRLKDQGWDWGYGIHRNAHTVWTGHQSAYLGGVASDRDPLVLAIHGHFHDPQQYTRSPEFARHHTRFARSMLWNVLSPSIEKVMRDLRADGASGIAGETRKS